MEGTQEGERRGEKKQRKYTELSNVEACLSFIHSSICDLLRVRGRGS